VKAAYADPPYLNCGKKHYGRLHKQASEYDDPAAHKRLVERLVDEYEAWALSTHTPALRMLLGWCPEDVRVCAWVKPFGSFKGPQMAFVWEPVLVKRPPIKRSRGVDTVRDFVIATPPVFEGKNISDVPGEKPVAFCEWLFAALALKPTDEFHDLFPGSGAVGMAWDRWRTRSDPEQFSLEASA
jgi:hypothetical protein